MKENNIHSHEGLLLSQDGKPMIYPPKKQTEYNCVSIARPAEPFSERPPGQTIAADFGRESFTISTTRGGRP